ncbi:MAG TPA: cytochrome c [Gemmatimonadales bacterium]|nr:cytochrome c [Gemmatimonadales bacterium]
MKSPMHQWVAAVVVVTLLAACGGGQDQRAPSAGSEVPGAGGAGASATPSTAVAEGSLSAPSGPVDAALADRGRSTFQNKGCIGCHTIGGGKLTGPDLQGVTERRQFGWIMAMVTNPDSMLKADPVARQLFAQYMTPMANMNVSREEALALYEYLRRNAP